MGSLLTPQNLRNNFATNVFGKRVNASVKATGQKVSLMRSPAMAEARTLIQRGSSDSEVEDSSPASDSDSESERPQLVSSSEKHRQFESG